MWLASTDFPHRYRDCSKGAPRVARLHRCPSAIGDQFRDHSNLRLKSSESSGCIFTAREENVSITTARNRERVTFGFYRRRVAQTARDGVVLIEPREQLFNLLGF
jgi:hypothetical protein